MRPLELTETYRSFDASPDYNMKFRKRQFEQTTTDHFQAGCFHFAWSGKMNVT